MCPVTPTFLLIKNLIKDSALYMLYHFPKLSKLSEIFSYLSPTRLEAAPAYAAGENETSENEEKDNNHDAETNNQQL